MTSAMAEVSSLSLEDKPRRSQGHILSSCEQVRANLLIPYGWICCEFSAGYHHTLGLSFLWPMIPCYGEEFWMWDLAFGVYTNAEGFGFRVLVAHWQDAVGGAYEDCWC